MKCNGIHKTQIETYNEYIVCQIYSSLRLDRAGLKIALFLELKLKFPQQSSDLLVARWSGLVPMAEDRRGLWLGGVRYDGITRSDDPSQSAPSGV